MVQRRLLAAVLAALMTIMAAPVSLGRPLNYPPPVDDGFPVEGPPAVSAAAWILFDESSDTVLAAFSPDEQRAMASITKIMTALVTIEQADLDQMVTISQEAADTGEREIGLVAGEQLTVEDLLKAALIHSGNDAATAIAEHVGGSVPGFVGLMNQRAGELGMDNTSFANPHGLDAPGHHSSASDMLVVAREAMQHREFRDIVRSRVVVFPPAPDGTSRVGTATNLLLGAYDGATGIKTGFTNQALLTFVASAEREGRELYAVVLGSEGVPRAHMRDAETLFDYGFEALGFHGAVSTGNAHHPRWPRAEPGPLTLAASLESTIHLAAAGLLADPPVASETAPEPIPPPVTVTHRHPERATGTIEGAFRHWMESLLGG